MRLAEDNRAHRPGGPHLEVKQTKTARKRTWGLNVGCQWWSGRTGSVARTAAYSQNRKRREILNPEADLQLFAPLANRELFKSRFGKARKMNDRPKWATASDSQPEIPRPTAAPVERLLGLNVLVPEQHNHYDTTRPFAIIRSNSL